METSASTAAGDGAELLRAPRQNEGERRGGIGEQWLGAVRAMCCDEYGREDKGVRRRGALESLAESLSGASCRDEEERRGGVGEGWREALGSRVLR